MDDYGRIACVTGASGMIGSSIARKLLSKGFRVRILTRNHSFDLPGTELFIGDLNDQSVLFPFLTGAKLVFHCAAELKVESRMWEVNVLGTERLVKLAEGLGVEYFCFMSSAGVTGLTDETVVNENTPCHPQDTYESSKYNAEKMVEQGINNCTVVVLRPTNVIDDSNPGVLMMPIRNGWRDRCLVLLKGGELAHIIHAEDVADAALYFTETRLERPECYIVSCDQDSRNSYSGLWMLFNEYRLQGKADFYQRFCAPIIVPQILRSFRGGKISNKGNIRYSSEKLLSTGFRYVLGIEGAIERVASFNKKIWE